MSVSRPHLLYLQRKTVSLQTPKYFSPPEISQTGLLTLAPLSQCLCVSCCHHSEGRGLRCAPLGRSPPPVTSLWPDLGCHQPPDPWRAESEVSVSTNGRIASTHSWPLSTWGSEVTYLLGNLGRRGMQDPYSPIFLGVSYPQGTPIWLLLLRPAFPLCPGPALPATEREILLNSGLWNQWAHLNNRPKIHNVLWQ